MGLDPLVARAGASRGECFHMVSRGSGEAGAMFGITSTKWRQVDDMF